MSFVIVKYFLVLFILFSLNIFADPLKLTENSDKSPQDHAKSTELPLNTHQETAPLIVEKDIEPEKPLAAKKSTDDKSDLKIEDEGGNPLLIAPTSSTELNQDNAGLTIGDAMKLAEEHSFNRRIAIANKESSVAAADVIFRGLLPSLSLGGTYSRQDPQANRSVAKNCSGIFPCIPEETKTGSLTLSQPLTGLIQSIEGYRIASKQVESNDINVTNVRRNAQLTGASSYINLERTAKMLEIAKSSTVLAQQQEQDAKHMFEVGRIARKDYLQISLQLSQAIMAEESAKQNYEVAISNFYEVTGIPREQPIRLSNSYELLGEKFETPSIEAKEIDLIISNRQDIQIAQKTTDIKKSLRTYQAFNYIPQLSFFATYSRNFDARSISQIDGSSTNYLDANKVRDNLMYGVNLSWVVWDWGVRQSQIEQASADVRSAFHSEELTRSNARVELSTNYFQLRSSFQNLKTAKVAVKTAMETYKVTLIKFKVGQATATDLTLALNDVSTSQASLANAKGQVDLSYFSLKRSIGEDLILALEKDMKK